MRAMGRGKRVSFSRVGKMTPASCERLMFGGSRKDTWACPGITLLKMPTTACLVLWRTFGGMVGGSGGEGGDGNVG